MDHYDVVQFLIFIIVYDLVKNVFESTSKIMNKKKFLKYIKPNRYFITSTTNIEGSGLAFLPKEKNGTADSLNFHKTPTGIPGLSILMPNKKYRVRNLHLQTRAKRILQF